MSEITNLVTAYQARYSAHVARKMTRQDTPASASSVDTAKLTATATDAIGRFEIETGVTFEGTTVDFHLSAGVEIMAWFLMTRAQQWERADRMWSTLVKPSLENVRNMRSREVTQDPQSAQRTATTPAREIPMDWDEDGSVWDGIQPGGSREAGDLNNTRIFT